MAPEFLLPHLFKILKIWTKGTLQFRVRGLLPYFNFYNNLPQTFLPVCIKFLFV